jgi:hypothetical protein
MEKKPTIAELETMTDTHNILPDGTVVRKDVKQAVAKQRIKEPKRRKGSTCMCMDCGKVIKVKEQSKHNKECPNSHWLKPTRSKRCAGTRTVK